MSIPFPKLTILTSMVHESPWSIHSLTEFARRCCYKMEYGGHSAVTRSLAHGLLDLRVSFNYNPVTLRGVADTVIVLSDTAALGQMIALKRSRRIKNLLAGPNLVVIPADDRELIAAPEIDVYLVNSDWTYRAYLEDEPRLSRNCAIWASGVDTYYWKPLTTKVSRRRILLYQKNAPEGLCDFCYATVKGLGYQVTTLRYGDYKLEHFLRELRASDAVIFLSQAESQGIALAESWSTDLPTIVWDPGFTIYKNKAIKASSAPYLTNQTGLLFTDQTDFAEVFAQWECDKDRFSPRNWVLANMSDKVSAANLLNIAGCHQ